MNILDSSEFSGRKARIEIIPLIDVVFFLLATFVLFTLSLNKIADLDTPLPRGGEATGEDLTVYVQATDGGMLYWKQGRRSAPEMIAEAELAPRLADYRRRTAEPRVFVRGDDKAKYGPAVRVLDAARRAGIRQVSIETLPSRTGD